MNMKNNIVILPSNQLDGSKKPKMFSTDEIKKFLNEAPDEDFLYMKAILVFGVAGGCSLCEIANTKISDVKDDGTQIIVCNPDTKSNVPKVITINGNFAKIIQKYMELRSPETATDKFFLQYKKGVCRSGMNMAKVPKRIAKFLKLDDHDAYNSRSIVRSYATILADTGAIMKF